MKNNRVADSNTLCTAHIYSGDGKWKTDKIEEWAPHLRPFLKPSRVPAPLL